MTDYNDDLFAKEIINWLEDVTESDADGLPIPPSFTIWVEGDDLIPDIPDDVLPPSMTGPACPTGFNLIARRRSLVGDIADPLRWEGVVQLYWTNPGEFIVGEDAIPDPSYQGTRICVTKIEIDGPDFPIDDGIFVTEEACTLCGNYWCEDCPTENCGDMVSADVEVDLDGFTDENGEIMNWPINGHVFTTSNTGGWIQNEDTPRMLYCITAWAYCGGEETTAFGGQTTVGSERKYTLCFRGAVKMPYKDLIPDLPNYSINLGREC